VKPPTGIDPEEIGVLLRGGVVGGTVGTCDSEFSAAPHEEQNRLSADTAAEQDGHVIPGEADISRKNSGTGRLLQGIHRETYEANYSENTENNSGNNWGTEYARTP
jgi:hypothetical protein